MIIYRSRKDDRFMVEFPELLVQMVDGVTFDEAIAKTQVITAKWLETAPQKNN